MYVQEKAIFKLNIYFLQYKFYSRKNRELDMWKMKQVKKTSFHIRQESKQEAEALPKTKALSSFYWESLIKYPRLVYLCDIADWNSQNGKPKGWIMLCPSDGHSQDPNLKK